MYAFLEAAMTSQEKSVREKYMITIIRIYLLLENSLNDSRRHTMQVRPSKKNVHGKFPILSLQSKHLET